MACIAYSLYDPAVAVTRATTSAIAMTALDTTNLRLTFTVPPSGRVLVRMQGAVHGATTCPQLLFGVLEGATVRGRVVPKLNAVNMTAASLVVAESTVVVGGLTPGAQVTWDAAYGVETAAASTGIKYGGPDSATGNNAFGGFSFEVWHA
jgi:hypothetical protein